MSFRIFPWLAAIAFTLCGLVPCLAASPAEDQAQSVVHMLDYIGVDYPQFVRDGKVLNAQEYAEQREFAAQAVALLERLPQAPDKPALVAKAQLLLARIDAKAPGAEVSALADTVRAGVTVLYKLTVAPRQAPDLARAASLFGAQCAACHGAQGHGDGPLAASLDPKPSNFHGEERMRQRSIYGLYNTIALGVAGTPMRAFTELPETDRWALAFFVSNLRATPATVAQGESLWRQGRGKDVFSGFASLVAVAPADIATKGAGMDAVRAYLTAHPESLQAAAPAPLDFTRARLDESLQALRRGDREGARQLAISAYLEGFELVEASLDNVDAPLRAEVEREMMALRGAISGSETPEAVTVRIARIDSMLDRAGRQLSEGGMSPTAAFLSSLLILLREGLEAILVLSAIIAVVRKTGRKDALPYVHAGWIAALALGVVTWAVANYLIGISGANREITEGVTALIAAAMLLYVGYWLHSKSYAQAWTAFIREQVNAALGKRTLWAMAGISFLAVYRELFEVILFYETLWTQAGDSGHGAVFAGIAVALLLLALLGAAILKFSVRLPIGLFFSATSWLLALLAVVFVGNGIAALQEAGIVESTLVGFFSLPLLGVHPTVQGLGMQLAAIALIVAGVVVSRRQGRT